MTKFYVLREDKASRRTGDLYAEHKWGLPGVRCPTCGVTWSDGSDAYPSVNLSELPNRREYEEPRPEPFEEFARLRAQVQPLVPPGIVLGPGSKFGPLVGTASGTFGPFFFLNPWTLLVRREVLEQLQAAGVRGLKGCATDLRFRQKNPPELVELELAPRGLLHPDCLPPDRKPPCPMCGRDGFRLPEKLLLDAASLPTDTDLFRLASYMTVLVGSERFAEAVRRLELDEIVFQDVPIR